MEVVAITNIAAGIASTSPSTLPSCGNCRAKAGFSDPLENSTTAASIENAAAASRSSAMNRMPETSWTLENSACSGRPWEPTHMRRTTMNQTKAMAANGNR